MTSALNWPQVRCRPRQPWRRRQTWKSWRPQRRRRQQQRRHQRRIVRRHSIVTFSTSTMIVAKKSSSTSRSRSGPLPRSSEWTRRKNRFTSRAWPTSVARNWCYKTSFALTYGFVNLSTELMQDLSHFVSFQLSNSIHLVIGKFI